MNEEKLIVETRQLCKNFGPTVALNHVDLKVYRGQITGLIGENGSGKSTITSILAGMQPATSGEIYYKGELHKVSTMIEGAAKGIGMIVQEQGYVPGITIAQNIFLGKEEQFRRRGIISHRAMIQAAQKALDDIGCSEINNRLRGVSRMASLEIILERYDGPALSDEEKKALAEKKNNIYRELLGRMTPADLPVEVKETLDALRAAGLKLAIGSSSKNAPFILERIGLAGYFDAVSDGNNITRSKPDPQVFTMAAEFLSLAPEECLVVEDAVAGAEAGHAGGFAVACVGDAAQEKAGDYNMDSIRQLLDVI